MVIAFASDPDITIVESLEDDTRRNIVAIEITGGADKSNIWNRLGEAEKIHQTAKRNGFVECWTIYNVTNFDLAVAREKSPSTNRFYHLGELGNSKSPAAVEFRERFAAMLGLKQRRRRHERRDRLEWHFITHASEGH